MIDKIIESGSVRFTYEQLLAQNYDRHLSVSANAGSGKTTVLQKRFINLLLDQNLNVEPRQLVAITFTRKSAAEIFVKIAKGLEEIIKSNAYDSYTQVRLLKIRERLNSVQISTIHSFCSSLIRDFPIESGISPNFTEISEAENFRLIDETITEVLSENLTQNDEDIRDFKELIRAFGISGIEKLVKSLLYKIELFESIINKSNQVDMEDLIHRGGAAYLNLISKGIINNISSVISLIDIIKSIIPDTTKIKLFEFLMDSLLELKLAIEDVVDKKTNANNLPVSHVESSIELLQQQKLINKSYTLSLTAFKKFGLSKETIENYSKLFVELSKTIELLKVLSPDPCNEIAVKYSRMIINLTNEINNRIQEYKYENNLLDFDDILIKTRKMLQDEKVSSKIRKRFKFLMVDEFQDTNDTQYDIIKFLIPELIYKDLNREMNLYIVGDPKQSIYGFRNADVRVFKKAVNDIKLSNNNLINNVDHQNSWLPQDSNNNDLSEKEKSGEINLTVSFRHSPLIASFTNIVCGKLMGITESEFDVSYNELVCTKQIEELIESNGILKQDHNKFGSISFILTKKHDKADVNSDNEIKSDVSEAKLLAHYLSHLIKDNTEGKKYKFSDIAILARTKTKFNNLIEELQNAKLPYIVHSGKGFFQAPEILDLISAIKFLHNTKDDISLISILRSPLFGMNDTKLFFITQKYKDVSLWEKLQLFELELTNDIDIRRINFILRKLINYSSKLSISNVLQQILELCGWYGTNSRIQAGFQAEANVHKLIQYARDFEKHGFKNLYDFVEEVNLIGKESINESEAVFLGDDDAVNIMTIHSAKGLEFRIVALYDTNSKSGGYSNNFIDDEFGIVFKTPYFNEETKNYDLKNNIFYQYGKCKNDLKEKAELKRLIYVALTRAKEHLIISADINSRYYEGSIFNNIIEGLEIEFDELSSKEKLLIEDCLKIYYKEQFDEININYPISIINEVDDCNLQNENTANVNTLPKILFDEIAGIKINEIYSASRIMSFQSNLRKYLTKYLLGFKDEPDYNIWKSDDDDEISGAESGTFIHAILEKLNEYILENGMVDFDKLVRTIEYTASLFKIKFTDDYLRNIKEQIVKISSTELIKKYYLQIRNSKTEAELFIPFHDEFLTAKIDLLLNNNGEFEVWDWKSNNAASREDMIELSKHYEFQMKLYTYFIMLTNPEQLLFKARLLFTQLALENVEDDHWTYTFQWTKNELKNFENSINDNIIQIKELI